METRVRELSSWKLQEVRKLEASSRRLLEIWDSETMSWAELAGEMESLRAILDRENERFG